MIAATKKPKRKPSVTDADLWEIKSTGEPVSDAAICAIAHLVIDRARRRIQEEDDKLTKVAKSAAR